MKKASMIREVQRQMKAEGFKWTQEDIKYYIYNQLENGGPDEYETSFDQQDADYFANACINEAIRDEELNNYDEAEDDGRDWEYVYDEDRVLEGI